MKRKKNEERIIPRKDKALEFCSMAVYYLLNATFLMSFVYSYLRAEFEGIGLLSNSVVFAISIPVVGFFTYYIYRTIILLLNLLLSAMLQRLSCSLYLPNSYETSLIGIVNCILMGSILFFNTNSSSEIYISAYLMLFSLPIGRLTFIDSTPCDIFKGVVEILQKAKGAWSFIIPLCIEIFVQIFAPDYFAPINIVFGIIFIVISLYIQLNEIRTSISQN